MRILGNSSASNPKILVCTQRVDSSDESVIMELDGKELKIHAKELSNMSFFKKKTRQVTIREDEGMNEKESTDYGHAPDEKMSESEELDVKRNASNNVGSAKMENPEDKGKFKRAFAMIDADKILQGKDFSVKEKISGEKGSINESFENEKGVSFKADTVHKGWRAH